MTEHLESHTGFGNEPIKTLYENGRVIDDAASLDLPRDRDAHYAEVEHLVDTGVANVADASKRVGYDAAAYELDELFASSEHVPTPGVSVSLEDRARAVKTLMEDISMQNKLSGAQRSGALNRYPNSGEVLEGMQRKAGYFSSDRSFAVETLAKTAALRAIGFDEPHTLASRVAIQQQLSRQQGAGPKAVAERNRQIKKTRNTADKVSGKKQ